MKRRAVLAHPKRNGREPLREGAKHSDFWNRIARATSMVPRQTEVADRLVFGSCKDQGIPAP